jgi:diguanylate cyclase (GGDEF)-like protein
MRNDVVLRIIGSCRTIEEQVARTYRALAAGATGKPAALWSRLADDEDACVRYWGALEVVLRDGGSPHLFDWPFSVDDELRARAERARAHALPAPCPLERALAEAVRLELLRLHPAVAALLQYGRDLGGLIGLDSPVESLGAHLGALVEGLDELAAPSAERELLGQALLELWRELRRVASQGSTDPLTGLLNRRGLLSAAEVLAYLGRRQDTRLAVLVLGVDHLKEVNDRHGEPAGDEVLKGVAAILERGLRKSDVLGRTGGDEFTVVALIPTEAPEVDVQRLAEKLRQAVAGAPWHLAPVTASVGASYGKLGGEAARDLHELLVAADENLYRAKHKGRNVAVVAEKP